MITVEEKTLIKSNQYNAKKTLIAFLIIGAILSLLLFSYFLFDNWDWMRSWKSLRGSTDLSIFLMALKSTLRYYYYFYMIPVLAFALFGLVAYSLMHSYELTVTNKRVFGRVAWGKRVDLPVDSISAIGTTSFLKRLTVSTSSGRISFLLVKNKDDIYNVVNELIIARQQKKETVQSVEATGTADELKKYKELLDSGVITQEEFEAKKKQLLEL